MSQIPETPEQVNRRKEHEKSTVAERESLRLQRDERNGRVQRLAQMRNRGAVTPAEVQDLADLEAQVKFDSDLTAREDAQAQAQEAK